jgi:hypothetical protein
VAEQVVILETEETEVHLSQKAHLMELLVLVVQVVAVEDREATQLLAVEVE